MLRTGQIRKRKGVAGQFSFVVDTDEGTLEFVSYEYGGPVVMVLPSGVQTFVSNPGRFACGPRKSGSVLNEAWVVRFLEDSREEE